MTETKTEPEKKQKHSVKQGFRARRQLLLAVGAFSLLLIGTIAGFWYFLPKQRINTSSYQIVYMTNGQAYFGKLQNTSGDYLVLQHPYTTQSIKANETDETAAAATATLIKVSDQVYGPEDSIAIKTTQVTFWQNLRSDSKVATAIKAKEGN